MSEVFQPDAKHSALNMLLTIAEHLLTQKAKAISFDNYDACRYKEVDCEGTVTKCAIGCLIPDHLYSVDIEGDSASGLLRRNDVNPELLLYIFPNDMTFEVGKIFIQQLQKVHDAMDISEWPRFLWFIATTFSLNTWDLSKVFERYNISVDMAGRPGKWDVHE